VPEHPVHPLNEEQLLKLGFQRQDTENGIKYLKGPFRILLPQEGNFSNLKSGTAKTTAIFTPR
jgi:hypothetical protein